MALIEFKNYSFTHLGQVEGKALNNLNLRFEEGTTTGILGNAGAGKSTLIKTMAGLAPMEVPGFAEGEIIVDGKDSRTLEPMAYSSFVGVVLDRPSTQLLGLTVLDDVAFGPSNLGLQIEEIKKRVDFALDVTRLKGMETRNPEELSGGQQQSLAIADILAMKPRVLALDEPVSMLDAEGKQRVLSIIKTLTEEKSTVVITESGLDLESIIGYLDRLVVLNNGEVFLDGEPERVMSDPSLDTIKVQRTQLADLFVRLGKVSDIRQIPKTVEEAAELLAPKVTGRRFRPGTVPSENHSVSEAGSPVVDVKKLEHLFAGPPDVMALDGIDVAIRRGEIVGLIGQNGSGKSTFCLHLVGVLKPTNPDATVVVSDLNVAKARFRDIIQKANYVFQDPDNQLFQETIEKELTYGLRLLGYDSEELISQAAEVAKEFDLTPYLDYEKDTLPRVVKTILATASAMMTKPSVLILDEPTNAMDRVRAAWFVDKLKSLNRAGLTVIVVSHNMELMARVCTRLVVMANGRIVVEGDTRSIFSQPEKLAGAKVKPPQITQLAQLLSKYGFPSDVLSSDEFFSLLYPGDTR